MKTLNTLPGGYPRVQDYLLTVQDELITLGNSILGSISFDVVLTGCAVTNNNDGTVSIAPGLVYLAGQVLRFDGANNIPADGSQVITTGTPVGSVLLTFQDTSTKNVYTETKGVIGALSGTNARQLVVGLTLLTLEGYIDARIQSAAAKGQIREFVFTNPTEATAFKAKFDSTGLGVTPDMLDWALMNGNNGNPDAQGRVFIGTGSITDTVTGTVLTLNSGDTGGEITHKNTKSESAIPDGMPGSTDGPHNKPGDGGGEALYYMTSPLRNGADAVSSHNNMQPYLAVFKIRKIR